MPKDYKRWTKTKAQINNAGKRPNRYTEGHIYWASIGENIGTEQDGDKKSFTRPVILVKGFSKSLVWCCPITSTRKNLSYYYPIKLKRVCGSIILSQLQRMDTLRVGDEIGKVDQKTLIKIKQAICKIVMA